MARELDWGEIISSVEIVTSAGASNLCNRRSEDFVPDEGGVDEAGGR